MSLSLGGPHDFSYDDLAKNLDANLAEIDMENFRTEDIHSILTLPTMCCGDMEVSLRQIFITLSLFLFLVSSDRHPINLYFYHFTKICGTIYWMPKIPKCKFLKKI
jgi:hypothetical protein